MELGTAIGIGGTVIGTAIAILVALKNVRQDANADGQASGQVLSELGYIKSGVDDIKQEQREQHKINVDFTNRITAVESSAKQAHHRLDRLEQSEQPKRKE